MEEKEKLKRESHHQMKYGKNILKPKSPMTMTTGKAFGARHNTQCMKNFFVFFFFNLVFIQFLLGQFL